MVNLKTLQLQELKRSVRSAHTAYQARLKVEKLKIERKSEEASKQKRQEAESQEGKRRDG